MSKIQKNFNIIQLFFLSMYDNKQLLMFKILQITVINYLYLTLLR